MDPSPIRVPDWQRFWMGRLDAGFLPELALRMLVLYCAMAAAVRLMGRRSSPSLTRNEVLAIAALAAAVGPVIPAPDLGLLPTVMIAVWVVLWQRFVRAASFRHPSFERALRGQGLTLVTDGVVDLAALRRCDLSRERLFAELRSRGLRQLGQVRRVYFETEGSFSVVEQSPPGAGLSLVPSWDAELRRAQPDDGEHLACAECGRLRERHAVEARCARCDSEAWVPPVAAPSESRDQRL